MKLLKSICCALVVALTVSLCGCFGLADARDPANFPNTTWIATDGATTITLYVQEDEDVRLITGAPDNYSIGFTISAEIIVDNASYKCLAHSLAARRTLTLLSEDLPVYIEGDPHRAYYEYTIAEFDITLYKSETCFIAKVASSEIIEEGKVFHFYRQDSE